MVTDQNFPSAEHTQKKRPRGFTGSRGTHGFAINCNRPRLANRNPDPGRVSARRATLGLFPPIPHEVQRPMGGAEREEVKRQEGGPREALKIPRADIPSRWSQKYAQRPLKVHFRSCAHTQLEAQTRGNLKIAPWGRGWSGRGLLGPAPCFWGTQAPLGQ